MKLLLLVSLSLAVSYASARLTEECQTLVQCMDKVQERENECDDILKKSDLQEFANIDPQLKCKQEVESNSNEKRRQNVIKDEDYKACLNRRPSGNLPPKKAEQCEAGREEYNALFRRVRRQARQDLRRQARRQQNKALKEAGKWEEWRALKGQKREFKRCRRDAKKLKNVCKALTKCCSAASLCHLEYELSDTHDNIKRAKLSIIEGRQRCQGLLAGGGSGTLDDLDVVSEDEIVENQF